MIAIGVFIFLPLLIFLALVSLRIQLRPLREVAEHRKLRVQLALTDILALLALLGVSGLIFSTIPDESHRLVTLISVWLLLFAAWFSGVKLASRAGVTGFVQRQALSGFATPLAAYGLLFLMIFPGTYSSSLVQIEGGYHAVDKVNINILWFEWTQSNINPALVDGWVAGVWFAVLLTWLIAPRLIARWAVSGLGYVPPAQTSEQPKSPGDAPLLDPHVKDLKLK